MNQAQIDIIRNGNGFIAALDQSGGSTPKALSLYGVDEGSYSSEDEMFNLVHEMRTRIITSPAFSSNYILGAILFEQSDLKTFICKRASSGQSRKPCADNSDIFLERSRHSHETSIAPKQDKSCLVQ